MKAPSAPKSIAAFWRVAPESVTRSVALLSAAVALTDEVANQLLRKCGPKQVEPSDVISCLHECSFVVARNSEWQFTLDVRAWLGDRLQEEPELARMVHTELLRVAEDARPENAGVTVPAYLTWPVGRAYHLAAIAPEDGLAKYAEAYTGHLSGDQWLLGVLAEEQQRRGVLPASAVEPAFIRGMIAYREGRWRDAEVLLRPVAGSQERRIVVAIAQHVCGVIAFNQRQSSDEAKDLFNKSLELLRDLGDRHGQAQVLHSLGNLLRRSDPVQAREYLEKSLDLLTQLGDRHGQAQVLHSLGNLLQRGDPMRAREYLEKSLDLLTQLGDRHGQAQVLNSLGKLVGRSDPEKAREYLEESLEIGQEIGNRDHQAQVLNTWGDVERGAGEWEAARDCYQKVIVLSTDPVSLVVAHLGLASVAEEHDRDLEAACEHMREAIAYQKRTGRWADVRRHEARLRDLERRLARGGQ